MEDTFIREKLPPELIHKINQKQLQLLDEKVNYEMPTGAPAQRKYAMQLRLLKKLNKKEYEEALSSKRKNPRFS